MSILNKNEIDYYLEHTKREKRLIITPILNKEMQIDGPGIDLRLSNQFIVFKPENISHFDLKKINNKEIRRFQSHSVVPFFKDFVLHPKTLVLAATFEYIALPNNLSGTLEGRSSWARLGLIIATACSIDPGYKGCITLELTNLGDLPLHLYPGMRIAKLILSETTSESEYNELNRKYFCQIGPEFSKANQDDELKLITGGR